MEVSSDTFKFIAQRRKLRPSQPKALLLVPRRERVDGLYDLKPCRPGCGHKGCKVRPVRYHPLSSFLRPDKQSGADQTEHLPPVEEDSMKLCRYDDDRMGVVRGNMVHDVTEAQTEIRKAAPYAMKGDAVVAALPQWRERIDRMADKAAGKPIASVKLIPPVARPTKLTCAPTNYQAHIEEMAKAATQTDSQIVKHFSSKILEAGMFLKANSALVGPSEGIPLRFPDRRNDHEVELVMVIGKTGSDIPQSKALDYVAGYCLGLDMTVRGREDRSFRKSVDGYAVLGPWMVTADEIADPDAVPISLTVNGETRQTGDLGDMIWPVADIISQVSHAVVIKPGDLIFTGTPAGVGALKPGDKVAGGVDGIADFHFEIGKVQG